MRNGNRSVGGFDNHHRHDHDSPDYRNGGVDLDSHHSMVLGE